MESNHNIVLLLRELACTGDRRVTGWEVCSRPRFGDHGFTHPSIQIRVAILPNRSRTHRQAGATEDRDVHEPTPESLSQTFLLFPTTVLGSVISHGCMPLPALSGGSRRRLHLLHDHAGSMSSTRAIHHLPHLVVSDWMDSRLVNGTPSSRRC